MEFFKLHFVLIFLLLAHHAFTYSSSSSDAELLITKIKPSLQGNGDPDGNILLSSWNTSVPLCQWKGLKWVFANATPLHCSDLSSPLWSNLSLSKDPSLHLLSLQLPSANLTGSLPRELGELSTLESLYLGINSLTGNIPLEVGYSSSLSDIDLGDNLLSGSFPASIWNLCDKLVSVRVDGNLLSGLVPQPALPDSSCKSLQVLDLGNNRFGGSFPEFITGFLGLKELNLRNNTFTGPIPESLASLELDKLDLAYNNFSGLLPIFGQSRSKFGVEAFEGNSPELCGPPLKSCRGSSGISAGAIAGIVIGLMAGAVVLASLLIGYAHGRKRNNREEDEEEIEEGEEDVNDITGEGGGAGGGGGEGKLIVFQGGEHLTLDDVLNATGQVMEKTSYGTIYKAKLGDGGTIALRLLREGSCKDGSSCLPVIRQLGRIRHENLIPLRAFYQGKRGEKLLIYDYLPNKNLHDLLHGKSILCIYMFYQLAGIGN